MMKQIAAAAVVLAMAGASPAYALTCNGGSGSGVTVNFGFSIGGFDSDDQAELDLKRLQRLGVNTDLVERWDGCLRAFVTSPEGKQEMHFYDPVTLERVL